MALFLSTFINKVDKKGRVSVPATFRAALSQSQSGFQGIVAFPSFTADTIEGCGLDYMENLVQTTDQMEPFSAAQDDITSLIFSAAKQLPWDPEGRIVLPEDLLAHAGIGDSCAFVGKGRTFQIWQPDAHRAAQEELRRRAAQNRPTLPPRRPTGGA